MQKTLPKGKREMYDINDGLLNRKKTVLFLYPGNLKKINYLI